MESPFVGCHSHVIIGSGDTYKVTRDNNQIHLDAKNGDTSVTVSIDEDAVYQLISDLYKPLRDEAIESLGSYNFRPNYVPRSNVGRVLKEQAGGAR
jgi:hypothetical protein